MLARIVGAIALLVLLAGCVINGPPDLVSEGEAVTPLPDFTFYPYSQRDGAFVLSEDDPMPFAVRGNHYDAGDGKMVVRFVPLEGDTYTLVVSGEDKEAIYGLATIDGSVLSLRVLLDSGLSQAMLDGLDDVPANITSDMKVDGGGILITRRDTLDFAIGALRTGAIPASPLVGWIGIGDAKPPARIVADGDRFVVAD